MSDLDEKLHPLTLRERNVNLEKLVALVQEIETEQSNIKKLEEEFSQIEASVKRLHFSLFQMDQRKADALNYINQLNQMVDDKDSKSIFQLMLEKESDCGTRFDRSLLNTVEKRDLANKELAIKRREILSLKQQIDEIPVQSELIQYEHRFSELYIQIQEKLQCTRKHYATYNALVEIKELMLKETSLLNSIISQFQDAITSNAGRFKLLESMETILKGVQQKLKKVQLTLHEEERMCNALKEKCSNTVAEQRKFSTLLKAFQEECAKNERLRSPTTT